MKISLPMLLTAGMGALLLWAGITDRDPIAVLKAVLTSQAIPPKGSGKTSTGATVGSSVGGIAGQALGGIAGQVAPQPTPQVTVPKTQSV